MAGGDVTAARAAWTARTAVPPEVEPGKTHAPRGAVAVGGRGAVRPRHRAIHNDARTVPEAGPRRRACQEACGFECSKIVFGQVCFFSPCAPAMAPLEGCRYDGGGIHARTWWVSEGIRRTVSLVRRGRGRIYLRRGRRAK